MTIKLKEIKFEQLASVVLCIISIILIIDTILAQFFNRGTYQSNLASVYCIAFILLSIKYKNILSKKYVTIPLYILIIQTAYSLITK
mgnify:CR=1 FL=1